MGFRDFKNLGKPVGKMAMVVLLQDQNPFGKWIKTYIKENAFVQHCYG